ncbi:MAG: Ku protein [Deltaproteobacteria bacterium]|nr:Ku protein [Deltaproteobacteria bacterium]
MAVTQKGAIAFGLVYIPVDMYTAVQDNDIRFNQLSRKSNSRVRYKKVDGSSGREIAQEDIVKGYQYDKDKYVVVTDEDFEKIKTEKDRNLQIILFTDHCTISPAYYNRSYLVLPQKGGEKVFNLLRTAMKLKNKVAVAKTVMGQKETLIMLQATDEAMLGVTLFYHDEIKSLPKTVAQPGATDAELAMAEQLLDSLTGPFEPEKYHDEYQERLRRFIEDKIEGREVAVASEGGGGGNVMDLMDALKKSLEENTGKKAAEQGSKPGKARKPRKKEETA